MLGAVILVLLLLVALGPLLGYLLLPFYVLGWPDFKPAANKVYNFCMWTIGLLPPATALLVYGIDRFIPAWRSPGGEPGLNFGYDTLPLFICILVVDFLHLVVWTLLLDGQRETASAPDRKVSDDNSMKEL